jgi:hypothetical protein
MRVLLPIKRRWRCKFPSECLECMQCRGESLQLRSALVELRLGASLGVWGMDLDIFGFAKVSFFRYSGYSFDKSVSFCVTV